MSENSQFVCTAATGSVDERPAARLSRTSFTASVRSLGALCAAALLIGGASQAMADPPGAPTENRVFADCTFNLALLQGALTVNDTSNALAGDVQASTIVIYVRQNPNGGQALDGGGHTGPIVCVNAATEAIDKTTESAAIPDPAEAASVDVTGVEQLFWLQYELNAPALPTDGDIQNRYCFSALGRTDCFLTRPLP